MTKTREEWLNAAAKAMKPWLLEQEMGLAYVDPLVSVGFPKGSRGKSTANTIGQCWDKSVSADKERAHIFVVPTLTDPIEVLAVLLHELVHASVGTKCGHRGAFKQVATGVGLEGKMTATVPGELLKVQLELLRRELGDYPHTGLVPRKRGLVGSRLLKVWCPQCGCILRMTAKWVLSTGLPTCGCGHPMEGGY
tara:strand:+ start:823 stop:1404 length:582 start_codon:yes stop_codon:yes gene_type:complete